MKNKATSFLLVICIPVVLFMVFFFAAPGFKLSGLLIIASQSMIPLVMALGLAFIMVSHMFDLSIGTQVLVIGILASRLALLFGWPGLIFGSLIGALLLSALVGGLYILLKIPSIVLSLGLVMILEYVGRILCGENTAILTIPSEVAVIGKAPYSYIFAAIALLVFCILYYRTKIGNQIKLVGDNEFIAIRMGINVKKAKFIAFFLCGLFTGIAAVLDVCFAGTTGAVTGMSSMSRTFAPMMAVIIALALTALYRNIVVNIIVGVVSVVILFNGVIALGFPASMQDILLGVFMLLIMVISGNSALWREGMRRRKVKKVILNME
jgi:ribose transport system permease protein